MPFKTVNKGLHTIFWTFTVWRRQPCTFEDKCTHYVSLCTTQPCLFITSIKIYLTLSSYLQYPLCIATIATTVHQTWGQCYAKYLFKAVLKYLYFLISTIHVHVYLYLKFSMEWVLKYMLMCLCFAVLLLFR